MADNSGGGTIRIPGIISGGVKGSGSTCGAGNCTSGTPPPGDYTKNPNDPSCTQTNDPPCRFFSHHISSPTFARL